MARRSGIGTGATTTLTPRAQRIAGWLTAALLLIGVAVVVGILGDPERGAGAGPSPSTSAASSVAAIVFGTALDPTTGEVATDARVDRFDEGDLFVYSVPPTGTVPRSVYVEVERTGGGEPGVLQEPVEAQVLPNPAVIAFRVPVADLLEVFGAGEFLMRIYTDPASEPIAEGRFVLTAADVSPAPSS
jgi:hypothetical protein